MTDQALLLTELEKLRRLHYTSTPNSRVLPLFWELRKREREWVNSLTYAQIYGGVKPWHSHKGGHRPLFWEQRARLAEYKDWMERMAKAIRNEEEK